MSPSYCAIVITWPLEISSYGYYKKGLGYLKASVKSSLFCVVENEGFQEVYGDLFRNLRYRHWLINMTLKKGRPQDDIKDCITIKSNFIMSNVDINIDIQNFIGYSRNKIFKVMKIAIDKVLRKKMPGYHENKIRMGKYPFIEVENFKITKDEIYNSSLLTMVRPPVAPYSIVMTTKKHFDDPEFIKDLCIQFNTKSKHIKPVDNAKFAEKIIHKFRVFLFCFLVFFLKLFPTKSKKHPKKMYQ